MSETLNTPEQAQATRVATAENLHAMVTGEPETADEQVAALISETGQAFEEHRASKDETLIADETGVLEMLTHPDASYTVEALSAQPPELLGEALVDLGDTYDEARLLEVADEIRELYGRREPVATHDIEIGDNPFIDENGPSSEVMYVEKSETHSEQRVSPELEAQQIENVRQLLKEDDLDGLNTMLASDEAISVAALEEVVDSIGVAAFKADTWFAEEGSRDKKLGTVAENLVARASRVPVEQSLEYIASLVGADTSDFPAFGYIEGALGQNPELATKMSAMLLEKKSFPLLLRHMEQLSVNPNELVPVLYENGRADLVAINLPRFGESLDVKELQERLYEEGRPEYIADRVKLLGEYDQQRLFDALVDQDKLYTALHRLEVFKDIDRRHIVDLCIERGMVYELDNAELLGSLDRTEALSLLMEHHEYPIILSHPDLFPDIDKDEMVDLCLADRRGYGLLGGIRMGKYTMDIDYLYGKLGETQNQYLVYEFSELFSVEQKIASAEAAIVEGHPMSVLGELETIPGLEKARLIEMAIQHGQGFQLFYDEKYVQDMHRDDIARLYLKHRQYTQLLSLMDKIGSGLVEGKQEIPAALVEALKNGEALSEASFGKINAYLSESAEGVAMPEALKLANRYMGKEGATFYGYKIVSALHDGEEVPAEMQELGVTKSGIKGLEQFGAICRATTAELRAVEVDDETMQKILTSELYAGIMQKIYRVDIAEFGADSEHPVKSILEHHAAALAEGKLAPLPQGYERYQTDVLTLEERNSEVTVDAYERYAVLRGDIIAAAGSLSESHPFSSMLEKIGLKMVEESKRLGKESEELANHSEDDKAAFFKLKNIRDKQAALEGLLSEVREGKYIGDNFALRSPEAMSHVFGQLEKFESLHSDLRQVIFAWAMRKNPSLIEQLKVLNQDPTVEDLGVVSSFVEQIVNQETFGNYFPDKKLATRFKKLSSVRSIDEALVRHQKEANTGVSQKLTLIPTRGVAMELSGYAGDACWAGKYESIAEEFPNITSIIMKRGEEGTSSERLVGSALFIETTDEAGEGVLLMRGVNPIENFINKVRVEDFYQTMAEYCRDTASKRGLKPAIVIDDYSGGAATNRPVLYEYMSRLREHMTQVKVDGGSSEFNGYDVTENSYAL